MPAERQRKRLTEFQKGEIVGLRRSMSQRAIGRELDIPHRTVSSFLQRFDIRHSMENLPFPGGPRKTSVSTDRYIVHTAESETRIPLAELHVETNSNVSERTLHRRLLEAGIRKWKAVARPLLTKKHAAQRPKWARQHQQWTKGDWRKVVWSDECAVWKDSDPSGRWVFRRQDKREKYMSRNIRGKTRDGRVSQMIWGCFMSNKIGSIALIDGIVKSNVYITVLTNKLVSFIDALNADGITDIVFQQDNASSHVSKKTHEFLTNTASQHGFAVMDWPPNSPNMNPIENLYAHLKLELHRRYPDTSTLRGSPATIKQALADRLTEAWWDIGEGVLDPLIESMPQLVAALITAKGWYTHY